MGGILELPTAAEPFAAEIRGESFYISTAPDNLILTASRQQPGTGTLGVPIKHLAAFTAALETVSLTNLARETVPADTSAWTVTRQDDDLVITGPMYVYGVDKQRQPTQSVELAYTDLVHLLDELARS